MHVSYGTCVNPCHLLFCVTIFESATVLKTDPGCTYTLLSPGHTVPIWRSRSLRSEKSWTSAWSAHEVVATSYKHLGSPHGRETIGKPVRQSFIVKLCCVGRDCGYDLFMDRFQSCVESETSWDCRTQRKGIRGQNMDGREDRINITIASCLIGVTFTFSDISIYVYIYISVYICLSFDNMSILVSWGRQYLVRRLNEKKSKLQLWQMGVRI